MGDANFVVSGMNEIHVVEQGDIVFVDHQNIMMGT
jgi:UDP-3-O-[3-hydroxymyristoyl] glucosamine N-acyltransferase